MSDFFEWSSWNMGGFGKRAVLPTTDSNKTSDLESIVPDENLPLPVYICHKRVQALKIKSVTPSPPEFVFKGGSYDLTFEDARYPVLTVGADWFNKHQPKAGGYFVAYPSDNYVSYSPAAAFEAGYTLEQK